jgi:hypothetical protein
LTDGIEALHAVHQGDLALLLVTDCVYPRNHSIV